MSDNQPLSTTDQLLKQLVSEVKWLKIAVKQRHNTIFEQPEVKIKAEEVDNPNGIGFQYTVNLILISIWGLVSYIDGLRSGGWHTFIGILGLCIVCMVVYQTYKAYFK